MISRCFVTSSLAVLGACAPPSESEEASAAPRPFARSVVLISIDTLRADHLGSYGYGRPTSPNLDALAARGARFTNCWSTAPWTVPAHFSMFTGLYPRSHGVDGWEKSLAEETGTLAAAMKAAGFATAAFVNVKLLSDERGYGRGFDHYELVQPAKRPWSTTDVVERVLAWHAEHASERYFLFVHLYDVHSDYVARRPYMRELADLDYRGPVRGTTRQLKKLRQGKIGPWGEEEARRLRDLYDAGIRQLDDEIRPLLDAVVADDVLVMVTSDHGEEFFDHGSVLHGRTVYEELVHVPLVLVGPGVEPGRTVDANVSIVDLMPTALASTGIAIPDGLEGVDLGPTWLGGPFDDERLLFGEADKWLAMEEGNYRRAVRRGSFKLVYDALSDRREVYDLSVDPDELHDLSGAEPALSKALALELERFEAGARELEDSLELSEEELEALKELGYF